MPIEKIKPNRLRLLFVDDELGNRTVFKAQFGSSHDIAVAESGTEALRLLETQPFDVLLTDQRMPGMTGLELLSHIRGQYLDMFRIIITAFADMDLVIQALNNCGIYRFFSKPWDKAEILKTLHQIASTQELRSANRQLISDLEHANHHLSEVSRQLKDENERLQQAQQQLSNALRMSMASERPQPSASDSERHPDWDGLFEGFKRANPEFLEKLKLLEPKMSPADVRLCIGIRLLLDDHSLAQAMACDTETLNTARSRLARKFKLQEAHELESFIAGL